ncbi:hypothetical protein SprV_0702290900 [Sparganum proliferum]
MHAGTLLICFAIITVATVSAEDDYMRQTMTRRLTEMRKFFDEDELGMKIKELGKTCWEVMWKIRQQGEEEAKLNDLRRQVISRGGECIKKIRRFFEDDDLGKALAGLGEDILDVLKKIRKRVVNEVATYVKNLKE